MINNTEHLIEQYTLGNLSSQEAKNFEQYLSENPDVQQQVNIQKNVVEAIKQKGRLQMKANLAQINPKVSSPLTQKIAIVAATLATATIVGFGIYTTTKTPQLAEQPNNYSETIVINELDNSTIESNNVNLETESIATSETVTSETETLLKTEETIALPSIATSPTNNKVETTVSNTEVKTDKVAFDPMSEDLGSEDEGILGTDEDIVTDPSKSLATKSEVKVVALSDSKIQGFTYNGKSIGISGTYETAYTVTQKQGMLIFEYDNKFYEIIECKKIEKWEDHEITDPQILKKL